MQLSQRFIQKSTAVAVLLLLSACCSDDPQRQSQTQLPSAGSAAVNVQQAQNAAPTVPTANTAQTAAPAIAVPQPASIPVPAYGPATRRPGIFTPPTGFATPGRH